MVLPSAPAGAGHVFCVSRCTDRDCCGNGGGARVENGYFHASEGSEIAKMVIFTFPRGLKCQNGHFHASEGSETAKMVIFTFPRGLKLPKWSFSRFRGV